VWHLAANIPDGLLYGIVPVALAGILSLIVFLVRTAGKNESRINLIDAATVEQDKDLADHEARIRALEQRR
jgi:hypothetical protein